MEEGVWAKLTVGDVHPCDRAWQIHLEERESFVMRITVPEFVNGLCRGMCSGQTAQTILSCAIQSLAIQLARTYARPARKYILKERYGLKLRNSGAVRGSLRKHRRRLEILRIACGIAQVDGHAQIDLQR